MLSSNALVYQNGKFTWLALWFGLKFSLIVPIIHVHLKLFGYKRTLDFLKCTVINTAKTAIESNDIECYTKAMFRLIRLFRKRSPLPGSCLSRSLTLWWLLQRKGIDTALHIGTNNKTNSFLAHAWVEYLGYPLNAGNRVRQRYTPFDTVFTY